MGLKSALMGKSGNDYLTEYTKKRLEEEEKKKKRKPDLSLTRGVANNKAGSEAMTALSDEYEDN
jgi:hypothetical protein